MRIEVLRYILDIAETGSISKAAEKNHMQQTTLSAALRAVEEELGYPIFNRTSTGVTLTDQGIEQTKLSARMLEDYEKMKALAKQDYTELSVYVNTLIYSKFYSDIYMEFSRNHPHVKVNIFKLAPEAFLKQAKMKSSGHRIGIESIPTERLDAYVQAARAMGYEVEPIADLRIMAYVNRANPLSNSTAVSFEMLRSAKILLDVNINADELRLKYGINNIVVVDGADLIRMIWLVNNTDSVGLFPEYNAVPREEILNSFTSVVPLPIEGDLDLCPVFTQCLVYRKGKFFSPCEKELVEFTRKVLKNFDNFR